MSERTGSHSNLLEVDHINTYYGRSHILHDVSMRVEAGEIVALLGLNGAGKTTTLRSILGLTPPKSGTIRFNGEEVQRLAPFEIARRGVGYVPEGRRMFAGLTVSENLQLAERQTSDGAWDIPAVFKRFPKLAELHGRKSGRLSGGEQEMLAIGRALVGNPTLLLVDEPSQGLAPIVVIDLYRTIEELKAHGVSILLVEQNALLALKISSRAYVLDGGRVVCDCPSVDLVNNRQRVRTLMGLTETADIP
jgi:branched-chain amino acid transport system ATP-binding protein